MADHTAKIQALETALASGVKQTSLDGQTTVFQSRAEMLAELNRLRADDDASLAAGRRRPRVARLNLGNSF